MPQISLKSYELGSIYSVTSNAGLNATFFPSKRMFMFLKDNDEVWIEAETLEECENLFLKELKQLAHKQRGGYRVGSGRPRSLESKSVFRITDAEKDLILHLRSIESNVDLPKADFLKYLKLYANQATKNLIAFVTAHSK
ncbi:hypothetical protein [Pseudoalteromonas sp. Z1A2]|uniref:hypothetical protein n=1 Tax=Pseudoalteromonas sp. Z1A2 TaxID=2686350 RepID=UPI0013FD8586|nr:hypothetical protein [Pseudoalteromonas sp. Z1A2]